MNNLQKFKVMLWRSIIDDLDKENAVFITGFERTKLQLSNDKYIEFLEQKIKQYETREAILCNILKPNIDKHLMNLEIEKLKNQRYERLEFLESLNQLGYINEATYLDYVNQEKEEFKCEEQNYTLEFLTAHTY